MPPDGFAPGAVVFLSAFKASIKPPPPIKVSEWAEKYREVPAGPHAGRWTNTLTPYLVEPMDCLSIGHPARRVTIKGSAQIGKTEVLINWLQYLIDVDPAPIYVALQSDSKAGEFNENKLEPSLRATKRIAHKVRAQAAKSSEASTTRRKRLSSGATLELVSVNGSSAMQSATIKYVAGDELAEWALDVDQRGSPVDQLETRQTAYEIAGAKSLYISTPGTRGACHITTLFEVGDQRKAYVPCPQCGDFSVFEIGRMRAPSPDTNDLPFFECPAHGCVIEQKHQPQMIARQVFVPTFESERADNPAPPPVICADDIDRWKHRPTERRDPSFTVWQAYSKLVGWDKIWEKKVAAEDNPVKKKAFFQQVLGEAYEQSGETPDLERLLNARSDHAFRTVPSGAYVLTAGVDVQANRIEFAVYGWGPGGTGWLIDFGQIKGDPSLIETWAKLQTRLVLAKYDGPRGQSFGIDAIAVDSGYLASEVYRFCQKNPSCYAIKGESGWSRPHIGAASEVKSSDGSVKGQLWRVGTDGLKGLLYSSLELTLKGIDPATGRHRPGSQFFPQACDEVFLRQLTVEYLADDQNKKTGVIRKIWVTPSGARNEQMDMWVYARAMASAIDGGIDSWSHEEWSAVMRARGAAPDAPQGDLARLWSSIVPKDETAPRPTPPRRVTSGEMDFRHPDEMD